MLRRLVTKKDIQPAEDPAIPIDAFCAVTPDDCITLFNTDLQYPSGLTQARNRYPNSYHFAMSTLRYEVFF